MQANENYKNILILLSSLNEKFLNKTDNIDLQNFAVEHKALLDLLQQHEHTDKEANLLIERIKEQEELLRPFLQSESERIKNELNRIRSLKHASFKYHTSMDEKARFIDKFK